MLLSNFIPGTAEARGLNWALEWSCKTKVNENFFDDRVKIALIKRKSVSGEELSADSCLAEI